jgi:hypothetical protein
MKYAIIETWNGEGYSFQNLARIENYNSDAEAQQRLRDLIAIQTDAKNIVESDGLITYDIHDDNGTFQFIKNAESIYGVVILTNENEAIPCDKKRWRKFRTEALAQCNPDDIDELDLSSDDFFIGAYENDYDYQFVRFQK